MLTQIILLLLFAYLLGGIPTAVILGKTFKGIDVREYGSKNSGATNAGRVLGKKWFYIVMLCDAIKGAIPVILALWITNNITISLIIGVVAILGHTFSIFLQFKGGKGVATSLGVIVVLVPMISIVVLLLFIFIYKLSGFVSLGSIVCAVSFPILVWAAIVLHHYSSSYYSVVYVGTLLALYIIIKHRSNIERLLKGNENKTNF